jgi:O-antigen/teichoic acid export membrane protein
MGVINLGLAWFLLPTLGIAGAGWAFLISQSAGSLVAGIDVLRLHYLARYVSSGIIGSTLPRTSGLTESELDEQDAFQMEKN